MSEGFLDRQGAFGALNVPRVVTGEGSIEGVVGGEGEGVFISLSVCQVLAKLELFESFLEHDDALESTRVIVVDGETPHSVISVAEHLDALRFLRTLGHSSYYFLLEIAAVGESHDVIHARELLFEDRAQQIELYFGLASLPNQYFELK